MKLFSKMACFYLSFSMIIFMVSCKEMKNEDLAASLKLSIDIPSEVSIGKSAGVESSGVNSAFVSEPLPGNTLYHLRVHINNPDETHFVFNYTPGAWMSIMAYSGADRVVTVDAYMVSPTSMGVGVLPVTHFVTTTPIKDRTITLQGEPVDIRIIVEENGNVGSADATPPFLVESGPNTTFSIPAADNCPSENRFAATITDLDWDLTFPSIPVEFYSGVVPGTLSVPGLPVGHRFSVNVFHLDTGLESNVNVEIASASNPFSLYFKNYSAPSVSFSPATLNAQVPTNNVDVTIGVTEGLGSVSSVSVGPDDTCAGSMAGNIYSFVVPDFVASCVINVVAEDCAGVSSSGTLVANIDPNPTPACMDGTDNDSDGLSDFPADPRLYFSNGH